MERLVKMEGCGEPLAVVGYDCQCGAIKRGVGFEFGHNGCWVVDLNDLAAIVREARQYQRTHPLRKS